MTTPNCYNWDDLAQTAMAPRIGRRMVSGEKMTEDTVTLEVFSPPREDFLTNAPLDYM